MQLLSVHSITATLEPGVYMVGCRTVDNDDFESDVVQTVRPDDPYGLGPVIRKWMTENPDFPVGPYVPPTVEEVRAGMQPLTARQFRLGLVNASISPSQVTATIAALPAGPDRDKAQIEWEYATTFNRMHPLIATVGAALGLTDTQIDAMWTAAISL
ncbi:hypothetical protein JVX98_13170 [Ensifer sp. PDNC004]|uniref:hypothetical protein n=1 Tax=Ensifer sp. PDNC004 TaxID=2811423 RepID=UPI0019642583|nr:hypothetical protein [Ensifer sp. PDNC004]QRY69167.1 hypothetical protein JVX98_13170 [Ensifer sp. PDNC004]